MTHVSFSDEHVRLMAALRQLHTEWLSAFEREMKTESRGGASHQQAKTAAAAAEKKLAALRDKIRRRRVRSWADVVLLAKVAESWGIDDVEGRARIAGAEAALCDLYDAVLAMGEKPAGGPRQQNAHQERASLKH